MQGHRVFKNIIKIMIISNPLIQIAKSLVRLFENVTVSFFPSNRAPGFIPVVSVRNTIFKICYTEWVLIQSLFHLGNG